MVMTFEVGNGDVRQIGHAPSMNAASADLPQGAYTTFRSYSGNKILRLTQHLRRLEESIELLNMQGQLNEDIVRRALATVLRSTGYAESRFRLTFVPPLLYVSVEPFTPYPQALYETGARCSSIAVRRQTPHAKSTAFIASAGNSYKKLPDGVHEGLMVADDGAVLEGLSSSFFAILQGVLHTEQERALVGVTQSLVLEIARQTLPALRLSTSAICLGDLPCLDECFITSVSREIMPVIRIDNVVIGSGIPGPGTRNLMRAFSQLIQLEARSVFA